MVLNLYLFRHGETEYNITGNKIGGRSNHLELSERGVKQARALGERLLREGIMFDELHSSTAVRAMATAEIVARTIEYPTENIMTSPELLELSQGDWEGKVRSEIYTSDVIAMMRKQSPDFRAPNGESQRDVEERIYGWVERNFIGRQLTVGVFGHGMATKCFLRKVLGSNPDITYKMEIDNCSITHLIYTPDGPHKGWGLTKVNDNSHINGVGFSHTRYA